MVMYCIDTTKLEIKQFIKLELLYIDDCWRVWQLNILNWLF